MNHMAKLLKGFEKRRRLAKQFWARVTKDNETLTPSEIAAKYTNPKTNKPYSRGHIQWILAKARNEE